MPRPHIVKTHNFRPDFNIECRECGEKPTVHVVGHIVPDTELCGPHFFNDKRMVDHELWNDEQEGTE